MIKSMLIVGLGGFAGSSARYLVQRLAGAWLPLAFPYGTFIVNISGALLIGFLYGLADRSQIPGPEYRVFLFTGVLGGFTTFSAFTLDILTLLRGTQYSYAFLYAVLTVVLGIIATIAGYVLFKSIV